MARRRILALHLGGWALIALLMLLQEPGRTAADTKLDLLLNPAGFLAQATSAWTDTFTLGQLQNQAYGYLFPQGLFFVLTDWLPDWLAQRAWWTVALGTGYSGMLYLLQRFQVGQLPFQVVAAALYVFSPRAISTLSTISSETWPVMLAPWVIALLADASPTWRTAARASIPVALMGAVNATATLAACLPAGIYLLWRISHEKGPALKLAGWWLLGCLAVSAWWIVPLIILGLYAPPFTDYIESAYVTTRWLNLAEILRGTTSWAPFVEAERTGGWLLTVEPVFVLATMAVAALGVAGLARSKNSGVWVAMLFVGVAILGAAHGPWGEAWQEFLNGPGAAFRNLHKFDPLVRIPLLVGVAGIGALLPQRAGHRSAQTSITAGALVVLVAVVAIAPAWSGRLAPRGTWEEVPQYWYAATDYVNEHAAGTRTLILPEASFARQEWGWTRDEPAQPLLDVPWAVRDAIPLVPPEAIRGLDGVMRMLDYSPQSSVQALRRLGIGAVLIRHDLDRKGGIAGDQGTDATRLYRALGPGERFGEVEVILLDPEADLALTSAEPVTVSGGGEILAFLDAHYGPGPRELVGAGAEVVTDTPMAVARNFGTLRKAVSAPLAHPEEADDLHNREIDYQSAGDLVSVAERGGRVTASSSAADPTSFGGADPARSITAAVDGSPDTAWWPTPGPVEGQWLELAGDFPDQAVLEIETTEATTLRISNGDSHVDIKAGPRTTRVVVPGPATGRVRIEQQGPVAVGIVHAQVLDHEIERIVSVPPASDRTRMIVLQQLMVDTNVLLREVTTTRPTTFEVATSGYPVTINGQEFERGDVIDLPAGTHLFSSQAAWVTLTEPGFDPSPGVEDTGREIMLDDANRLLLTGRAFNPGLRAHIGDVELAPRQIDAAAQAFVVPAGVEGEVEFSFVADRWYQAALLLGGILALLAVAVALGTGRPDRAAPLHRYQVPRWLGIVSLVVATGWIGVAALLAVWVVRRVTVFRAPGLAAVLLLIAGAWLARSPWPAATYAGDEPSLAALCAAALACLVPLPPARRKKRRAGSSMNS